ncbi:hypothetical protein (mitochondrion) [Myxobolus squamalis]|uniref:Uncharacterized protein n=1 Tax=Myxobolus squamalis TaxID=59785 RepID=A0A678XHX9_MYXSQ|nr:hypothetical protein [Myxobolus squamalis]
MTPTNTRGFNNSYNITYFIIWRYWFKFFIIYTHHIWMFFYIFFNNMKFIKNVFNLTIIKIKKLLIQLRIIRITKVKTHQEKRYDKLLRDKIKEDKKEELKDFIKSLKCGLDYYSILKITYLSPFVTAISFTIAMLINQDRLDETIDYLEQADNKVYYGCIIIFLSYYIPYFIIKIWPPLIITLKVYLTDNDLEFRQLKNVLSNHRKRIINIIRFFNYHKNRNRRRLYKLINRIFIPSLFKLDVFLIKNFGLKFGLNLTIIIMRILLCLIEKRSIRRGLKETIIFILIIIFIPIIKIWILFFNQKYLIIKNKNKKRLRYWRVKKQFKIYKYKIKILFNSHSIEDMDMTPPVYFTKISSFIEEEFDDKDVKDLFIKYKNKNNKDNIQDYHKK